MLFTYRTYSLLPLMLCWDELEVETSNTSVALYDLHVSKNPLCYPDILYSLSQFSIKIWSFGRSDSGQALVSACFKG